ncbi:FecR family protein, partial [Aureimonas sp. Leaf460]|uniref:FecR family protein n=2 Tax=unclassified Aureimonas TaxID=2615206 RepID=UPI0009E8F7CF
MTQRLIFSLTVAITLLASGLASAREWVVDRVSGAAFVITPARERIEIKRQMSIAEGLTITTTANGRVRLVSDNNVMTLLPNSAAAVTPKSFFSSKTEVLQRTGSIEFDIEKRSQPHFTVQTPYMAAVVKGTKFTVSVASKTTKIGVDRGLVQVSDLRTGQSAAVGAGQNASVSAAKGGLRTGGVNAPAVSPGKPAAASVAPMGVSLSDFRSTVASDQASPSKATEATNGATKASGISAGKASSEGNGKAGGGNGNNGGNSGGNGGGN